MHFAVFRAKGPLKKKQTNFNLSLEQNQSHVCCVGTATETRESLLGLPVFSQGHLEECTMFWGCSFLAAFILWSRCRLLKTEEQCLYQSLGRHVCLNVVVSLSQGAVHTLTHTFFFFLKHLTICSFKWKALAVSAPATLAANTVQENVALLWCTVQYAVITYCLPQVNVKACNVDIPCAVPWFCVVQGKPSSCSCVLLLCFFEHCI